MINAKIQPQSIIGSGEEDFLKVFTILVNGCNHFSNYLFPQPKEAPYEIWAKLAQGLQKRSRLKMLTDGHTDGWTTDEKWSQ